MDYTLEDLTEKKELLSLAQKVQKYYSTTAADALAYVNMRKNLAQLQEKLGDKTFTEYTLFSTLRELRLVTSMNLTYILSEQFPEETAPIIFGIREPHIEVATIKQGIKGRYDQDVIARARFGEEIAVQINTENILNNREKSSKLQVPKIASNRGNALIEAVLGVTGTLYQEDKVLTIHNQDNKQAKNYSFQDITDPNVLRVTGITKAVENTEDFLTMKELVDTENSFLYRRIEDIDILDTIRQQQIPASYATMFTPSSEAIYTRAIREGVLGMLDVRRNLAMAALIERHVGSAEEAIYQIEQRQQRIHTRKSTVPESVVNKENQRLGETKKALIDEARWVDKNHQEYINGP